MYPWVTTHLRVQGRNYAKLVQQQKLESIVSETRTATFSIEGAQRLKASENIYIKAVGFDFKIDRWSRNHTVKPSLLTLRKVLIFEFVTTSYIEPLWHWFTDGLLPGTTHCYLSRTESVANWIL